MQKFKDENNQVHDPEMNESEGLAFLKKVQPNKTFTAITDAEADILSNPPETPAEAGIRKDAQVDAEFTPALIAIVTAMNPANSASLITQAKAQRKTELP